MSSGVVKDGIRCPGVTAEMSHEVGQSVRQARAADLVGVRQGRGATARGGSGSNWERNAVGANAIGALSQTGATDDG
jgi:hypothetical protein